MITGVERSRVTTVPSKPSKPEYHIVPEALRNRFNRLTVHFDFLVRKEHVAEFREAWNQSAAASRDRWGPFSSRSDASLGLTVFAEEQDHARHAFHAVVEFRRGSTSPYTKISDRRMRLFTASMRRLSQEIKVTSWSQVTEIQKAALEKDPRLGRLFEASGRKDPSGYTVRLTGLETSFEKEGEPLLFMSLRWGAKTVTMTESGKGFPFASLDELFNTEKAVVMLPELQATRPAKDEDDAESKP